MVEGAGVTLQLHHGDCLEVLRTMPDASVDAVVTDPPYGLAFMGSDRSLTYLLGNPPEVAPQHSEQPRWLGYVTEIVTELYKFRPVAYCPIQAGAAA